MENTVLRESGENKTSNFTVYMIKFTGCADILHLVCPSESSNIKDIYYNAGYLSRQSLKPMILCIRTK
jgi:hypothetical protein